MNFVFTSGGMDPIHIGHVRYLQEASKYGSVIVLLNSDDWLTRKKGKPFMGFDERREILLALKPVYAVYEVDDRDETVCDALKRYHSILGSSNKFYFAKGGDRGPDNTPELETCELLGIEPLFGVGGEKIQSSSELVRNAKL